MAKGGPLAIRKVNFEAKTNERSADESIIEKKIRKDFPESWIFDDFDGDNIE